MSKDIRIYKYEIPARPGQHKIILDPVEKFLDVQFQGATLVLWAVVCLNNSSYEKEEYSFVVHFTGPGVECEGEIDNYMGTAQSPDGLVYHVFRRTWIEGIQRVENK